MELKCLRCGSDFSYAPGKGLSKTYCVACYQMVRKNEMLLKAIEYMGGKCKICGYNDCKQAMEFHSLAGDLVISKVYNWSWDRIKAELIKTEILCCRCHREFHSEI